MSDDAEHFVRQCKLELERYPRSTLPYVVSRDWLAGAAMATLTTLMTIAICHCSYRGKPHEHAHATIG